MEAFIIQVSYSEKLNSYNWAYFEKNELSVSASGRLVHILNGVLLDSVELAEQYRNVIKKKRFEKGDKDFDAEIVRVSSSCPNFALSVIKNSESVREKLNKWNDTTSKKTLVNNKNWIIQIRNEDNIYYLVSFGKNGEIKLSSNKNMAKVYKQESFVKKVLNEVGNNTKLCVSTIEI